MWLKIKGFEKYEISENGDVRTTYKNGKIKYLKLYLNPKKPNDYLRVTFGKGGKYYKFLHHRVLALQFISNPENKPFINHKDGNRQNNSIDNLEWVTHSENTIHSIRVTKTWRHPNPMNGKFGKEHNCSKPFIIEFPNGTKKEYGSQNELDRELGIGRSISMISWARKKKKSFHEFKRGKMKGLVVHFELAV